MKGSFWTGLAGKGLLKGGGRKVVSRKGVEGMGFLEGTPGRGLLQGCSSNRRCWKVGGMKGAPGR